MKYSQIMNGPKYDRAICERNRRTLLELLDPFSDKFELSRNRADVDVLGDRRLVLPRRSGLDTDTPEFVGVDPAATIYENEDAQMVAYAFSHACLGVC